MEMETKSTSKLLERNESGEKKKKEQLEVLFGPECRKNVYWRVSQLQSMSLKFHRFIARF